MRLPAVNSGPTPAAREIPLKGARAADRYARVQSAIAVVFARPCRGVVAMTLTVEAVYENGVLRPTQPLPLQEHEKVQVTVKRASSRVRQTAGLIGWTGSQ